ncbi:DNA sulfur modification protein DndD [Mycobacterium sp. E796]|uniref:DNA sulfur modification protein DndD n=1 Tax=Mycobacterium sp. E796 TaxID=1834151 RepID=UPI0007FD149B|nr:DNA sulfur modification protein DndD [Mycobacterium sp. E796]OBI60627.1 DNA sulfur modification protein DndD [Mycobacterium sp. E796]
MILDELVLQNVGTFAGRQTISLSPKESRKPIVLIGGLNGTGKTTILEAIHLALYGPLAQVSGRGGSYDAYLRGLIHRNVAPDESASVELSFRAYQQGEEHHFRVRRRWRTHGASLREFLLVSLDGRHDEALTSTWSEYVETFLPRGIAGLFFFDGEQIEKLADSDSSRQVLSSALAALLGLDLIDRLSTDLSVLRRRHRDSQVPDSLRETVAERRRAVTALRQAEEAADAAVAALQVEVERASKRLHEATERYRSAGGDLLDQRDAAEIKVGMLKEQLISVDNDLREEMSDTAPLLQVTALLCQLAEQVDREVRAAREAVVVDVIAERDAVIVDRLRADGLKKSALDDLVDFLAKDRRARQTACNEPTIVGTASAPLIKTLRSSSLPTAERRLSVLVNRRRSLSEDLDQAERVLVAIPDQEALAPLVAERKEAASDAMRAEARMAHAQDRLASCRQDRAKADAAYEATLDRVARATLSAEDDRRLVEHAERVRVTLQALRLAAAKRHLGRISDLIFESLGRLLRKTNLITRVEIDPETYSVELTGADGRALMAWDLSAGERQLLAVALLWGLARSSGQPLPIVIDTPLGRLDRSHRGHLLERYFPQASHQVILLSTDTEIDADAIEVLRPHVGRSYKLEFDPSTNATTIAHGYFWENAS